MFCDEDGSWGVGTWGHIYIHIYIHTYLHRNGDMVCVLGRRVLQTALQILFEMYFGMYVGMLVESSRFDGICMCMPVGVETYV